MLKSELISVEEVASHFSATEKVKVVFTKKDGSERTMICTNNPACIPDEHKTKAKKAGEKPARKTPEGLFVVFDLEAGGWRSFAIAKVISIEEVKP